MSIYSSQYGMESINAELMECINELRFRSIGIVDVAVVSLEGLPLVSLVLERVEETRFAAMTAAMLSLGERVSTELNKGLLKKIFVEGDNGHIVSMQAGENAVLTVSATTDTKLGLLFLDMERASAKISKILTYR
ncbi:MAG: roadblock/LC7 domain-containing protein [Candidatus Heimdallarchaeota archaeon]|nr:roadblock/LC7 domain-containing protein [Candidatus Heimdallarchaeota archaeon]MCK5142473.1 roadblock/LC7 domain-containing protein [Candidatus Heimdallarchaeota archaeon]